MAKKEIQFSLVYRDMWQSSGKYVPRKDQLAKIAPVIIDMAPARCRADQPFSVHADCAPNLMNRHRARYSG